MHRLGLSALVTVMLVSAVTAQQKPPSTDAFTEACLRNCGDNVNCKATCLGVPTPTAEQVNQTNACIKNCNRANISTFMSCEQNCIHMNFMRSAPSFQAEQPVTASAEAAPADATASTQGVQLADPKPADNKPVEAKHTEGKPADSKPADGKPNGESKPTVDGKSPLSGGNGTNLSGNSTKSGNKTVVATGGAVGTFSSSSGMAATLTGAATLLLAAYFM